MPPNPDPAAFYHQVYDACRRKSQTPEGAFAAIDRDEILGHVRQITETLKPVLEQMQSAKQLFRAVSIGDPAEELIPSNNRLALKRFNPLSLSVAALNSASETVTQAVELHGQLPWVWQDADEAWHVLVLTGSGKNPKEPDKYVLGPVLFYLICLSGDESCRWIESSGLTVHIVYREIVKEWTYRFDRETAEAYLVELVSNVLNQSMRAWLPFEPVTTRSIRPHKLLEDEINDVIRMQFAAEIEDAFAEEEDYLIRIAKPTIPVDAFDRVRRRFKIYFDHGVNMFYKPVDDIADIDLTRHALIEASAGTGKTYTLENLVVRLLKERQDIAIENILMVTFTEKATSELKTRIQEKLLEEIRAAGDGHSDGTIVQKIRDTLDAFDTRFHLHDPRFLPHGLERFCI